MAELRYTLLAEGRSDRALLPILDWLLKLQLPDVAIQADFADLSRLPHPPKELSERIRTSVELYPCDVLFVHRDADNQGWEQRQQEIRSALAKLVGGAMPPTVCVIPIRMTETWLFLSEAAIRQAASCPQGRDNLEIPPLGRLEAIADPKSLLETILKTASGCTGRRLKTFRPRERIQRIAELIEDFSPLRQLEAFQRLEADIKDVCGTTPTI
ncbi:MAG: hypothetical protein HC824_14655 [Synechococcales cyanobacterium RM1_1_8]|nr:hypothetical protein [Synechococcales cyanobacterium RM1_1_8]